MDRLLLGGQELGGQGGGGGSKDTGLACVCAKIKPQVGGAAHWFSNSIGEIAAFGWHKAGSRGEWSEPQELGVQGGAVGQAQIPKLPQMM